MRSLSRSRSSSHVSADGAVAGGDRGGVADHHAGVLPAAGELDGVGGGAAGGELDGESHAAAVRGSATIEAGRGAGGRQNRRFTWSTPRPMTESPGSGAVAALQATDRGRAAADQAADVGMILRPDSSSSRGQLRRHRRGRGSTRFGPDSSVQAKGDLDEHAEHQQHQGDEQVHAAVKPAHRGHQPADFSRRRGRSLLVHGIRSRERLEHAP